MFSKGGVYMNERFKQLRDLLKMSQEQFGGSIGLSKSGISNIENGSRNVTEKHVKLICSEFNVNENWLRTGDGEIFIESDSSILNQLSREYNLDQIDMKIIEAFLGLPSEDRDKIKSFITTIGKSISTEK